MFGATSTTDEVLAGVNLKGKRYLVTGVSAGLGVETARALVARGADVIGTARDLAKAKRATEGVKEAAWTHGGSLQLVEIDLASLASVRAGSDLLVQGGQKLDGIIANAGVMACPFGRTEDGFETQFGTNHLGHFLLVNRIAGLLKPGGRLVNVSSAGHRYGDVDLDDPNFEHRPYAEFAAYGQSKTANILFAVEFHKRHLRSAMCAMALHPGAIQTELDRHMSEEEREAMIVMINRDIPADQPRFAYKSVAQGAATSVWAAAVAPAEEIGGRYCEDCHVADIAATPSSRVGVQPYALDGERAAALWALSEKLVGESF